ncbi:MAG: AraC family transcriptional regulator, partial [Sporichthya sp.]
MAVTVDPAPASTGRLGVWRDLIRDHFVSLDVSVDRGVPRADSFRGQVRTVELGALRVAEVASIPQAAHRTVALARDDRAHYFQLGLLTGGRARLTQDGRECALAPGDFAVYETDRPFTWDLGCGGDPWRLLVFTWPRDSLELTDHESADLTARQLSGAHGFSGVVSRMLRDLAG